MKMRRLGIWSVWIVCLGTLAFLVYSQWTAATLQAQEEQEPAPVAAMPLQPEKQDQETAENITVDFKDADVHDVLKIISYKSGVNIVAGNDVQGTVTIRLVDVPWEKALDVILKNAGFVYERDQDIIRVTTLENLGKEELSTDIFILNYADAEQVTESIKSMLTERGSVKIDARTNQLVVTDVPTNLYKVEKVIEKLDKRTAQVLIEARIIETTLDEDENLGIDWTLQATASGAIRPINFPWAWSKTYGKTGLEYFPPTDPGNDSFDATQVNTFPYAPYSAQSEGGDFRFGTISFSNFQFALELLKSRSDTRTLSNPRIMTLNNKEATIHVGRDYGVPIYERNTSTGTMEITGYSTRKVGVKLIVTPHVNAAGEIVVDLHPEVSAFLSNQAYGDIVVPVFTVREAVTQIMIADGDTIVIGELITDTEVDYVKKVPILGDIPLIKYAFRKTEKDVDTTDLIIFVTVRLIEKDEEADGSKQAKVD
ncbi:MAG: secretin and TonB N-terminal domain-containing protein [Candidatus Omnitrophica bacterium]|nr:secretin and TonB N-terminal domain-containing protein [Candidatus Omnitrophota bacterium]